MNFRRPRLDNAASALAWFIVFAVVAAIALVALAGLAGGQ